MLIKNIFVLCLVTFTYAFFPELALSREPESFNDFITEGTSYFKKFEFTHAESFFRKALHLAENKYGKNNYPYVAVASSYLALTYINEGKYDSSMPLLKRSLEIRENVLGLNHEEVGNTLFLLGMAYELNGEFKESETLFRRSLSIKEKLFGPNHFDVAGILLELGSTYSSQKKFDEAIKTFTRALSIAQAGFPKNHKLAVSSGQNIEPFEYTLLETQLLTNLSEPYNETGRLDESERGLTRALELIKKNNLEKHDYILGYVLGQLSDTYDKQGRYAEEEDALRKSLDIFKSIYTEKQYQVKTAQNNLASLLYKQGRYSEAFNLALKLIDNKTANKQVILKIVSSNNNNGVEDQRKSLLSSYLLFQDSSSSKLSDAITKLSLRFTTANSDLSDIVRKEQDLYAEETTIDKSLVDFSSRSPKDRNRNFETQLRKRLTEIDAERNHLKSTLSQKFPDYVALSNPQPLTIEETQQLLDDDEAVIASSFEEDSSYAWVVTKTDASWIQTPVKSADLNAEVAELRKSLTFSENGKSIDRPFNSALAFKIYQQFLGPIAEKIAGKKRLSFVTNGALTSIPLGLLVTKDPAGKSLKDTDWLIKSYAITVLPSIYSLKTMRTQAGVPHASKPIVAFADPVFSKAARSQENQQVAMRSMTSFYNGTQVDIRSLGEHLPQLPNTRDEVQTISKTLGADSNDIKLGPQATETAVKRVSLDQYRIVYFATHGLVAGDLEKFSKAKAEPALVLTIPNNPTEQDDGLLQASEIAQLKLNADWAVLSACNTASSDGVGAEALSGLARAFIYAGARSLVVSNWDVSDDATKSLMTNLFEISSKNKSLSHGEALQQATVNLLNNAKTEEEAHPRYWAPFMVVGEPAI